MLIVFSFYNFFVNLRIVSFENCIFWLFDLIPNNIRINLKYIWSKQYLFLSWQLNLFRCLNKVLMFNPIEAGPASEVYDKLVDALLPIYQVSFPLNKLCRYCRKLLFSVRHWVIQHHNIDVKNCAYCWYFICMARIVS